MANLKRRPDKDLNHDNWDEEDPPEEIGEFRRATEEDLRDRRILKPRRKVTLGNSEAASIAPNRSSNPFSSFSFSLGAGAAPSSSTSAFSFGVPSTSLGCETATAGGTGSLFKIAGITPSSEPPTRASADSSTADTLENTPSAPATAISAASEVEPEVGSISESEGITEESSNSSSLPWNVASRQQEKESLEDNAIDSNNLHGTSDMNNVSWIDVDEDDKEASAASSEAMQRPQRINTTPMRTPATSSAPADSSESSSASNPVPIAHFNFGNSFGTTSTSGIPGGSGSLFQPFSTASASLVSDSNNVAAPSSSSQQKSQSLVSGGFTRSPESSGLLVRSSLEDDSADYENDTTSSSNKLHGDNDISNDYNEADVIGANEDREAEADSGNGVTNEEREAEGVDS